MPGNANFRKGTYWGIRTDIADYNLSSPLPCPHERTIKPAETPTRLKRMPPGLQERLTNWGYAVGNAALRKYANPAAAKGFPNPAAGV